MQFRSIIRIVGLLLALFSVTMLAPALVALLYRDGAGVPFVTTFFCAAFFVERCVGFLTVGTNMSSNHVMAFLLLFFSGRFWAARVRFHF